MNFCWTSLDARPRFLYRVDHPNNVNSYQPAANGRSRGKIKTKNQRYLPYDEGASLKEFYQTIRDLRNQVKKLSPYISFFSSKAEAVQWALVAQVASWGTTRLLTIDTRLDHVRLGMTLYNVRDIQDRTCESWGVGGARNSEWLALHSMPHQAVVQCVTAEQLRKDLRLQPIIRNPHYTPPRVEETPKRGSSDLTKNSPKCGCKKGSCVHVEWPVRLNAGRQSIKGNPDSGMPNVASSDSGSSDDTMSSE
ncbi:hypothetical protein VTL71DRAFT_7987 [Oculimacula yallundae]|uniref:DUF7587 domain-containing protein n=1 Tax=Oculimacula yallundae TaxID=86028 RepID=A0ABR4CYR8_9HELO